MNTRSEFSNDAEENEADRNTASMGLQLSAEVASWTKQRGQRRDETFGVPKQPAPDRHARRPTAAEKKPSPVSVASKPTAGRSRPFSMSYDGQTQAEYTKHLLDRGTR
jgi:hypothetical protein